MFSSVTKHTCSTKFIVISAPIQSKVPQGIRYAVESMTNEVCSSPMVFQIFAVLELKHKPSSAQIVFVGTHLKAKIPFARVREAQSRSIVQYLSEHYPTSAHVIFAGDCNADVKEPFYQIVQQAGFSSAYRTMLNNQEPAFTTFKYRASGGLEQEQCHSIDYIFYKPEGLSPIAILKLPTKEEIGVNGLPSAEYPSDHLALEAIFTIKS